MKKSLIGYSVLILLLVFGNIRTYAQQGFGTNTPNQASVIDMESASKGVLIPRVELTALDNFEPIKGLNTVAAQFTANSLLVYNFGNAVPEGFYYWLQSNDTTPGEWVRLADDNIANAINVNNGLSVDGDYIQLGGELEQPTTITTDAVNTLAIEGLQTGTAADNMVVADPVTGVLKRVKRHPVRFYMPPVIFDTSQEGTNLTRNLYQDYVDLSQGNTLYMARGAGAPSMQYTPGVISSTGAPASIPVYESDELYYYILYYDTDVFANLEIDEDGVLTYDIIGTATETSYMTIIFEVIE